MDAIDRHRTKQGRIHGYPSHVRVGRGSILVTRTFGLGHCSEAKDIKEMGTNGWKDRRTDGQTNIARWSRVARDKKLSNCDDEIDVIFKLTT